MWSESCISDPSHQLLEGCNLATNSSKQSLLFLKKQAHYLILSYFLSILYLSLSFSLFLSLSLSYSFSLLSIYLSIYLSISVSIHLPISYRSIHLSFSHYYFPVTLSLFFSFLSFSLFIILSLSVSPLRSLSPHCLSLCPSLPPPLSLSLSPRLSRMTQIFEHVFHTHP